MATQMLSEKEIAAAVKTMLPKRMRARLRVQAGVHGCYRGTIQVWLADWPSAPAIPGDAYQAYCETSGWGNGPYGVDPRKIADHILATAATHQ
jgi:hypothetical protein